MLKTSHIWRMRYPLLLAAGLLLAGCGRSQEGSPAGPAGEGGSLPQGGELRINMTGEPDTIDPHKSNFATSILVASQVFDGLFKYDQALNLVPAVAKEIPAVSNGGVSADGTVYTVKLRNDVKWSDGKAVTANDFAYSIKRSLDPKLAAKYAPNLYDIKGAQEYNTALGTGDNPRMPDASQLQSLRDAVGLKATDDYTLVVELKAPRPSFLHLLALWVAWPVREDVVTQNGDKWTEPPNYIGNGPFILANWAHEQRMELVPNPNYYGEKPKLGKLIFLQMKDDNQAYLAYQNGELDMVAVPPANTRVALTDQSLSQQSLRYNDLVVFGYQYNVTVAPFSNAKVRQAFSMAVDRKSLIDKVAQGVGREAYSAVPPGMPGFDGDAGKQYAFNVAKAKELLAEAGFSDVSKLPKITFTFADTATNRLRAEFFQGQMKQNLGIDVALEPLDTRAFQQRFNASQYMVIFSGWGADYPDPDNFIPELFKSTSRNNSGHYSNPKVDDLATACQGALDYAKRISSCVEAQKLVAQDQPWTFLFYREQLWLVKPYVKGLQVTAKDQLPGNRFYQKVYFQK